MRLLVSIILSLIIIHTSFGQNTKWKEVRSISMAADQAWIDQLSNIYVVHRSELIKLNADGDELARYSNKLLGGDLDIDVTNPMKVLLFSADQMQLIFLDSRLSEFQLSVDLYQEGYEQISLVATSHSNGFWLFDPVNFRIVRYNQELNIDRESLNIAQMIKSEFNPTDMVEYQNNLYLVDPELGIVVFDIYGNFIKLIPLKGISALRFADDRLVFRINDEWSAFNLLSSEIESVNLDVNSIIDFDINRNSFLARKENALIIFKPLR